MDEESGCVTLFTLVALLFFLMCFAWGGSPSPKPAVTPSPSETMEYNYTGIVADDFRHLQFRFGEIEKRLDNIDKKLSK